VKENLKQDHHKAKPQTGENPGTGERTGNKEYLNGRGAQFNTRNRFQKNESTREHTEGIDDWDNPDRPTQYIEQESKTIVNKVESPDVGMSYSMNPYAGCEHGCIY